MTTAVAAPDESRASRLAARLPRWLIPYVGGMWGAVQFTDWTVNRYLLSPHLVDLMAAVAVALLPSIVLLAYFRTDGRPWTRVEKVGIPLNLVIGGVVLLLVFRGTDLGALMHRVSVTGGDGTTTERQVPKSAYRKRIAVFFFANDSGNADEDWVGRALPELIDTDLAQDVFVDSATQSEFIDSIRLAGADPHDAPPLALDQRIARTSHRAFIVSGRYTREHDDWVVDVSLAPTERGAPLADRRYRGPDLFKLVDSLTVQLRKDLGIPTSYVDSVTDLPVAEISTHSMPALRAYTVAHASWRVDNDARAAEREFDHSLALDATFALSALKELWLEFSAQHPDRVKALIELVHRNQYRIDERSRFHFESIAALLGDKPDPEHELSVLHQWATLYPDDTAAHAALAQAYQRRNQVADEMAELATLKALDPDNPTWLLQIGAAQEQADDFTGALGSYRAYEARTPSDARAAIRVADIELQLGMLDEARKSYGKARAIDENLVDADLGIARLEESDGKFDLAQAAIDRATSHATTDGDRDDIFSVRLSLLGRQGRVAESLVVRAQRVDLAKRTSSSTAALGIEAEDVYDYATLGRREDAQAAIDRLLAAANNVNSRIQVRVVAVMVALELGDAAQAKKELADLDVLTRSYAVDLQGWHERALGRVAELEGDFTAAADHLAKASKDTDTQVELARCQRKAKRFADAHATLAIVTRRDPSDGNARVELARLAADEGDPANARAEIDRALAVWAHADPTFKPALDARAFAASLAR